MYHDLVEETWLQIPGWQGLYDFSTEYRVRNARTGKVLKACLSKQGYLVFYFWRDGKKHVKKLHKIVMEIYVGPCPDGMEVLHKDDNKLNCHRSNLEYGTHQRNMVDVVRNGNHYWASKTHCPARHEYTKANTYIVPSTGGRQCRKCHNEKSVTRTAENLDAVRAYKREWARKRRAELKAIREAEAA